MNLKEEKTNGKDTNKFSEILTLIPLPSALTDGEGNILTANELFKNEFELTAAPFGNLDDFLMLKEGKGKVADLIARNSKDAPNYAKAFYKKADEGKYFKLNWSLLGEGKFIVTLTDVTAEESKERLFKCVLDNVDIVIFSMKPQGTEFDFISGAAKKILGFEIKDLLSHKFSFLRSIQKREYPKLRKFLRDLANGLPSIIEYGIVDKQGQIRYVRHSATPIARGNKIVRIVGAIVDVTHEAKLREKLKYSEEKFNLLMETAEDFIFTLDARGNFLMVSKNGAKALGFTADNLIGKHLFDFIKEEEKPGVAAAIQKILSSDEVVKFEATLVDNFSRDMNFEFLAKSIKSFGEVTGMVAIGRDITERLVKEKELRELNERLRQANRILSIERDRAKEKITLLEELNKLKNEFISNVSHEFRTPLASIVGFAEAIASDPEMSREMINEFNAVIYEEGKRLAKLIDDLLDFSKLDEGDEPIEKEDFELANFLNEALESVKEFAEKKKVLLQKEIPEVEALIHGDRKRLFNALTHILNNAVKFTDEGGRVTLILNNFLKEVEIIVSDTGVGIPPEDIPNLFEKFAKVNRPGAQQPGAGMGLALAKKIIDLHKGWISVRSQLNEGSTFIIRLPKKIS